MRASFAGMIVFLGWAGAPFLLQAQTNANVNPGPAPAAGERENRMISFLTPAEQDQYAKARAKALTDNPALKSEGENVAKQGVNALTTDATAADRQAFMEAMNAHRQKLRAAMLKEVPTLEPVFAQIDKHISEMRAKRLHATPPVNPPPGP